jgi:hypothetical protein
MNEPAAAPSGAGARDAASQMLAELRNEFPAFRIVEKRHSGLSRLIDLALRVVTFGGQKHYLSHYHTVIGDTLYVPEVWQQMGDIERVILLRHERVHLRQRRRWTLPGMAFLYLIPILPLGLAYGRARIEWEAYTETLRATAELKGLQAARDGALRQHILRRFTGPDYGWMWPFPRAIERWYDRALAEIEVEHLAGRSRITHTAPRH